MPEPGDVCIVVDCWEPAVAESLYGITPDGTEIVEVVCYDHAVYEDPS